MDGYARVILNRVQILVEITSLARLSLRRGCRSRALPVYWRFRSDAQRMDAPYRGEE